MKKKFLPKGFEFGPPSRAAAGGPRVDPKNEDAPPGVFVVDNGAPGRPGGVLEVDTLGDDKTAGDSQFIAPDQKIDLLQGDRQEGHHALLLLRHPPLDAGEDQGQVALDAATDPQPSPRARQGWQPDAAGPRGVLAPGRRGRRDARRTGSAAVPTPWNAVPNGMRRDPRHALRPGRRRRSRRSSTGATRKGWRKPLPTRRDQRRRRGRIPGPLIRARVGDRCASTSRTSTRCAATPHSMHFHGVALRAQLRRRVRARLLRPRRRRQAGQDLHLQAARPAATRPACGPTTTTRRRWRTSIAGGMYGAMSIRGRHEQRARPRVRRRVLRARHGFETIDGRAFVGNTPVFHSQGRRARPVGRAGDGRRAPHLPRPRPPLARRRRHARGHARRSARRRASACAGARTRPGTWLYHCHVETHMVQGMIGLYRVQPMRRVDPRARGRRGARRPARRAPPTTSRSRCPASTSTRRALTVVAGDRGHLAQRRLRRPTTSASRAGRSTRARSCAPAAGRRRSTGPGEYPFVCTLHAFMSGNLSVVAATIEAPTGPVLAGRRVKLDRPRARRARPR